MNEAQLRSIVTPHNFVLPHNSVTKPSASLHETDLFSAAATKGWAWCKHNAELVERTAALRDLKLLVGSGGLDFPKGMDSCNKHVEQNLFRQCVTFCEHRQLKGWQPRFQPTEAKNLVCSSHIGAQSVYRNKFWRPQLRDQTPCFSAWDRSLFFSCNEGMGMMQA